MHRHGLESVEREVRWLTELIETERTISSEAAAAAPEQRTAVAEAEPEAISSAPAPPSASPAVPIAPSAPALPLGDTT
jgi:hypothetical protein